MHRHARRPFIHGQPFRHCRIINRTTRFHQTAFERLEILGLTRRHEFCVQTFHRQIKQRQRPLSVIGFVRRERSRVVGGITAFRKSCIEGYRCLTAAATLGRGSSPFFTHEFFQRDDEESSEPAFLPVSGFEPMLFQQQSKEFLREVLCVVGRLTRTTHVGVKRIPISATNHFQRRR
jgi:hypothetical protein